MRDVVLDGRAIDVVDYAQKQDSGKTIWLLYGYIDGSCSVDRINCSLVIPAK